MIGARAKEALRRTAQWEKRTLGLGALLPPALKRPFARAIRKNLLPEGRRFIAADKLEQLFAALHETGATYVVIRWFEKLPLNPEGDIDFLIADGALPDIEALLSRKRGGIPCDLYSESGRPGFRYGNIAYYPPSLAGRILERRTLHKNVVSVPCPEDHFFSLAYHCLYHKGLDCGLPTSQRSLRPVSRPNHDYLGTLAALASELGLKVELNMEALETLLHASGWRPPRAMLERLAIDNVWIRDYLGVDPAG